MLLGVSFVGFSAAQINAPIPEPFPQDQSRTSICPSPEEVRAQIKPLSAINVAVHDPSKELPPDCSEGLFQSRRMAGGRFASITPFHWRPTEYYHQPLYFDDLPLERYGQSISPTLQPVISSVRFFGTFPIVPYKIGVDRTHDLVTTMGHYRPGSYAPCIRERLPLELDASIFEATTALALIFILP